MAAEPRSAAACILVRGDQRPEVLLAKRNPALRFMGGQHVFPGGRIQQEENVGRVRNAVDDEAARAILAAVREVFEETGLLCVRGDLPELELLRTARDKVLRQELEFNDFLAAHDLMIEAEDFEPAGQWLTPAFVPIRFATHYFLYRVRDAQQDELVEGEIVGLDWMTPAEARDRWHRGEIKISTPVAYTLRQLAAAGLPNALAYLQRGTERMPGEHNWFEVRRGVTLIPLKSPTLPPATHTNCLIVGERELFVIDPGPIDERELDHLYRQLDHLIELGGKVAAVVLSHSHPDHVTAADELRRRYDAPVWAHKETARQLEVTVDRYLVDGEVLTCGERPQWRLRCIHTPGHDPGHLCFLEESTGALLAGDMVANPGSIVVAREYGGDMTQFIQSLERLLTVDCKLIIPSHGHPAGSPHDLIRKQLEHRLWREAKIKSAYDSGAHTIDDLLATAYDDAPEQARAWARHALDAHLAKLGIELAGY